MTSPYVRALGERSQELHPALERYFDTIAPRHVGIGDGVFTRVGTPRRWLWPLLRCVGRNGALWAGWAENVPFTVRNRTSNGQALGERVFHFPDGDWVMRDAASLSPSGTLVDRLGTPSTLAASFEATAENGTLKMHSRAIGVRLCGIRFRLPRCVAPRIELRESFDEGTQRQHVALTVKAPLIGRLYEYAGSFSYRIEEES